MTRWDVTILGGGVLGITIGFWLSAKYDGNIAVVERESSLGAHATWRNTGVIHRPFYLHPKERRVSAKIAATSYPMWKKYALERSLPWAEVGTLKVATNDEEIKALESNLAYAQANGMGEEEIDLLTASEVSRIEPEVACVAALNVKTDTAVDFKAFTDSIRGDAERFGVKVLTGHTVTDIRAAGDALELVMNSGGKSFMTKYLINCAGGNAVDIAHKLDVAGEYADLHFRGEYWVIDQNVSKLVRRNVYSVPRNTNLPFLDPHWVVRANGRREIGPNAVPVPGPLEYEGLLRTMPKWIPEIIAAPTSNKIRFLLNRDFVTLSTKEMWCSLSKLEMMRRVQRFIPRLRENDLTTPGTAGIRSATVDAKGRIVKETLEVPAQGSYHILNYNSPGATGAPAFGAHVIEKMAVRGDLDHLTPKPKDTTPWDWDTTVAALSD